MNRNFAEQVLNNEGRYTGWIIKAAYDELGISYDQERFNTRGDTE